MDKKSISQTWAGNMYQKFEAMYQEVDEFINKDSVKYVENHIQNVSESMKKFYVGFMQDLILPPLAVTHTKESSLIPTEKCPEPLLIEEANINRNFEHEDNDLSNNTSFQEVEILNSKKSESDSSVFEDANWGIENIIDLNIQIEENIEGEENCEKVIMETLVNDEFECDSSSSRKMESLITCNNENKEEKTNSNDSSMGDYLSASSYEISSCESSTCVDHDTNNDSTRFSSSGFSFFNETSDQVDSSMVDFEDLNMETIDLSDKDELVESCVIVEGENVFSFPYGSKGSKSYKKIIQDAFMSRKKLTKEYKQLAVWCGDIDKELSKKPNKNATKSQVQDFPDSEWEIL